MNDILVVFIALLILTAILYYLKIYRDNYLNMDNANDEYSTVMRLESETNALAIDQEQLAKNLKQYQDGLSSQVDIINKKTTQMQLDTNAQLESIRFMHLSNSDIIGRFSSNLSDVTAKVSQDSKWIHVVYGEVLKNTQTQQVAVDDLSAKYTTLSNTVDGNNVSNNTRLNNIANGANNAFASVTAQLNSNNDKTFTDINNLTNTVTQINTAMSQANTSIAQVKDNITTITADYLPKSVFQSSMSDINNNITNLNNDYISKTTLGNTINNIQAKFANYPTTQEIAANYYPLKSGQTLEALAKTTESKLANLGTTPDYVMKSTLTNNYYDKAGVDGAITNKLNGYLTTANGNTLYYPLKSGQTLESSVKAIDGKVTTGTLNSTALTSSKLCLGATCVDETQLQKLFGIANVAIPK